MIAHRPHRASKPHCPWDKGAVFALLLVGIFWFVLLVVGLAPSRATAQTAEQQAALAEATRLNQEAATLYNAGKFSQAEPPLQRALAITEKALGPAHPDVATSLNNLALLYNAKGELAQAEPLHKRALAIQEKALRSEHPDVATSLENYAALLRKMNRATEAEAMEARAKAIRAKHAQENPTK